MSDDTSQRIKSTEESLLSSYYSWDKMCTFAPIPLGAARKKRQVTGCFGSTFLLSTLFCGFKVLSADFFDGQGWWSQNFGTWGVVEKMEPEMIACNFWRFRIWKNSCSGSMWNVGKVATFLWGMNENHWNSLFRIFAGNPNADVLKKKCHWISEREKTSKLWRATPPVTMATRSTTL